MANRQIPPHSNEQPDEREEAVRPRSVAEHEQDDLSATAVVARGSIATRRTCLGKELVGARPKKASSNRRGSELCGLRVSRASANGRDRHVSTFDLHWTIASDDGLEHFVEPHRMGLCSIDDYLKAFAPPASC